MSSGTLRALRDKIIAGKPTLKQVYGSPLYGIKTGLNDAFVIDTPSKDKLCRDDPRSAELFKPFLEGKDLKRWRAEPRGLWIIYIPKNRVKIDDYPAIRDWLLPFKDKLEKRATKQEWFELQQAQEAFAPAMEAKKIGYPSKHNRMVNIGRATGKHWREPGYGRDDYELPNFNGVDWLGQFPRGDFTQSALNEIGSFITLFRVRNYANEFLAKIGDAKTAPAEPEGEDVQTPDDDTVSQNASLLAEETTADFVLRRIHQGLSGFEFEHFAAHLMECMGYAARVLSCHHFPFDRRGRALGWMPCRSTPSTMSRRRLPRGRGRRRRPI